MKSQNTIASGLASTNFWSQLSVFSDGRVRFTGAFHDFHAKTDLTLQNDGQLKVILKWGYVLYCFGLLKQYIIIIIIIINLIFLRLWYILGLNMHLY